MKNRNLVFAIDFDGTLCAEKWPGIGPENTYATAFVRELRRRGHRWILYTLREGAMLDAAVEWLRARRVPLPDAVNTNLPDRKEKWGNDPRKVSADVYIDDRNAGGLCLPWGML